MSSQKGPKHIYAKNINCITIIFTLEDIEKIKIEERKKKDNKAAWIMFTAILACQILRFSL